MRIVISGSSGMVGHALVRQLRDDGHWVLRLVREGGTGGEDSIPWDPAAGILDPHLLEAADAVVNLNGRNLAERRWNAQFKADLVASRIGPTRLLASTIAGLGKPPALLLNVSAVGYYGDRGEETLDESSAPGAGFLSDLVRDWEAAALAASSLHTRVVLLRLGLVVSHGGAVARMERPFRLGLGGPIGSGTQWWPWVAIDDVLGAASLAIANEAANGPLNVVSPQAVRCRDLVRSLGQALGRPAVLPLPASIARLALGEMAEVLLASQRVLPSALERLGYQFRVSDIAEALRKALRKGAARPEE